MGNYLKSMMQLVSREMFKRPKVTLGHFHHTVAPRHFPQNPTNAYLPSTHTCHSLSQNSRVIADDCRPRPNTETLLPPHKPTRKLHLPHPPSTPPSRAGPRHTDITQAPSFSTCSTTGTFLPTIESGRNSTSSSRPVRPRRGEGGKGRDCLVLGWVDGRRLQTRKIGQ